MSSMRILMFPWIGHGHVLPFLELAKKLSKRNFHIYFCSTPIILGSIGAGLNNNNDNSNIELVELHLPSLLELPPHYHSSKDVPPHLMPTLLKAFEESAPPDFSDIISELKPDLLIYDVKQPWAAKTAASQGIPRVFYSVAAASTFAFAHHLHTYKSSGDFPFEAMFMRGYEVKKMMPPGEVIQANKDDGEGFLFGVFELSNDVVLAKTSRAVEGKYLDYLSTLCERKVIPTGPLITFSDNQETGGGGGGAEILKWLGEKERERGSTLYISFGSENYLSKGEMKEIAKGLELSGVSFIWVAREPPGGSGEYSAVPEGFVERTRGKGIIVTGWAPQTAILAHRSVGGFMSHCGWSSITESLYFGVPVVAVPLKLDQPMNARLVVEAGVGVEVARDEDGEFDGEGVAKAIKKVFVEEREGMRSRAREMSEKVKMEEEEAMDGVVEELSKLCIKKSATA